jgi:hypothetical protein
MESDDFEVVVGSNRKLIKNEVLRRTVIDASVPQICQFETSQNVESNILTSQSIFEYLPTTSSPEVFDCSRIMLQ